MNVLIIPEDFRKDQYVLKPILTAMMRRLGRQQAKVEICVNPLLGGIGQALKWDRIEEIINQYKSWVDLFLLCVDRDGIERRRAVLDAIEQNARVLLGADRLLLAENAWQEIEVWLLAGHDLPTGWVWRDIREEVHPKERYYWRFAELKGVLRGPGEGRKTLAEAAARRYGRIRGLCPEDVASLEARVQQWLAERS